MKRVIFIGNIACGKTTLGQVILGEKIEYKKTQAVEVLGSDILDTPGEYLEMNHYRGALMITSADADVIAFVQSATDDDRMFPPSYAGSFAKPVIGIVTKTDIATKQQVEDAAEHLKNAGAGRIFRISSYKGSGLRKLIDYLNE